MPEANVILVNPLGLHARAAAKIVRLANEFESVISIMRPNRDRYADARSILGILELGAKQGTELIIEATGRDEISALEALKQLIVEGFGEI
ncbi:MAG: HPr family phosphocarrier protein [Acidobacteria bacterium]|nr:MAG: HPr family phosphocarrier protein [Acidobacteriota bacterium]